MVRNPMIERKMSAYRRRKYLPIDINRIPEQD